LYWSFVFYFNDLGILIRPPLPLFFLHVSGFPTLGQRKKELRSGRDALRLFWHLTQKRKLQELKTVLKIFFFTPFSV
jgi:hypothetical protein